GRGRARAGQCAADRRRLAVQDEGRQRLGGQCAARRARLQGADGMSLVARMERLRNAGTTVQSCTVGPGCRFAPSRLQAKPRDRLKRCIDVSFGMIRTDLEPDLLVSLRYDRIIEPGSENAL